MLSREKEEGTVTVLAEKPRPALPLMQKLILDFLRCAVRQPSTGSRGPASDQRVFNHLGPLGRLASAHLPGLACRPCLRHALW